MRAIGGFLAVSASVFAVAVVALLVVLFLLLLVGSLVRARRGEGGGAAGAGARAGGGSGPRPKAVLSRRDFFRGGLLASFLVFTAQFGGASLAFLWPQLKGGSARSSR